MGYNRDCFEHNLKWKKEQRRVRWLTESIYVDVETGEIINKNRLQNGEYIKVKSNTKIKTNDNNKSKTITTECKPSGQGRIF